MRLIYFFVLISNAVYAQSVQLEPNPYLYDRFIQLKSAGALQIDTLIQLSVAYSYIDEDSSILLGERAVALCETAGDRALYAKALVRLGDLHRIFKDMDTAERLLLQGKAIYTDLNDDAQLAATNNILGALMKNRGDNEGAIQYYIQALETWEALKDTQNILKPLINISAAFFSAGRPQKAIRYNEKALELARIIHDDRAKSYVANNMGIIYNSMALEYLARADTAGTTSDAYRDSAFLYIDRSLASYQLALELAEKKNDQKGKIRILGNMVDVKITKGEYREALQLSRQVETQATIIGANASIIRNTINQAKIYRLLQQLPEAIRTGETALQLAADLQMERDIASAHEQLYPAYQATGQLDKALASLVALKAYTDKNGAIERNKAIAEVEAKYQNVQKEKQILEQRNDILELEAVNATMQTQRNYLIGGLLLFSILGFFAFHLNRYRRQRNDKIAFAEALIFAQEEERKRIARDLHDGIGQSLLLIKRQMAAHFETTVENRQLINQTLEEVRAISRDLHPFQLQQLGLTSAIQDVIRKVGQSGQLFISHDIADIDSLLPDKIAIHLFRVIQEALSNIVKHAQATAAKVSIRHSQESIWIKVQDNGKGFDPKIAMARSNSLGLRTLFERVAAMGGTIKISSGQPKGTIIDIHLPKSFPPSTS